MAGGETGDLRPYLARMNGLLESTLARLANTTFRSDPIGGAKYSRATSIISSAYKRHGQILGSAILERLKECSRFTVWTEDQFKLSATSRAELGRALPPAAYRQIRLPYGDCEQSIPVDLIAHEPSTNTVRSYNVKRGNGAYDAGKKRLIVNELLRTQMHLAGYARSIGITAETAEAYIIFYYGLCSAPDPYCLVATDLDNHFAFPVMDAVEAVNTQLRTGLYDLIEHTPDQAADGATG